MRFLHLSDIHFKSPECLTPGQDENSTFRYRVEEDVAELCEDIPARAIFVGGDIAFKGAEDEYQAAQEWLFRIADTVGCERSQIFVVPGNHDVNRRACQGQAVLNAQEAIARAPDFHARDDALKRQLRDKDTGPALFLPLEAYNNFAAQFSCAVRPERPFWTHDLELNDGVKLRVFGLTSTLISGAGDRDVAAGRLFLGTGQTTLTPEENVVSMVMSHHPPSWFTDPNEVSNAIDARAHLQLFGHEHDQRCVSDRWYMRFLAGAVNPERDHLNWCPGYNLVDLKVVGEGIERKLEIEARLRQLQSGAVEQFIPLFPRGSKDEIWRHTLSIPQKRRRVVGPATPAVTVPAPTPTLMSLDPDEAPPQSPQKMVDAVHKTLIPEAEVQHAFPLTEAKVSETSVNELVFRFWQLGAKRMRDVALELGLITSEEVMALPPHRRYEIAVERAVERGLLAELAEQVTKYEKKA
ncbi:Calcineurin-like phosphoesterase [Mitsuaria sp. PDC51]|uniref:metallophosphoesterase n=1 Tax=Mitsuaria sp. PDC51 TaxID=1881035 RepID=UPI0008F0210D|nr:metallophosphoesterase [Mitsuaria sp. PDC51]SFR71059.1 Calcineurin-like phosphoesterase [Mitsuaria sp. PDC51]